MSRNFEAQGDSLTSNCYTISFLVDVHGAADDQKPWQES